MGQDRVEVVDLRRSEDRRQVLVQMVQLISSTLELPQVFGRAAREIERLTGCHQVSLLLVEEDQGHGFALEFVPKRRWLDLPSRPLSSDTMQWVIRDRRIHVVEPSRLPANYRTGLEVPLVCRDRVVAILVLASRQADAADTWDLTFLAELASMLAIAVDHAAAYREITRLKARVERENVYLRDEIRYGFADLSLIGSSPAWQPVLQAIEQVGPLDSTVLILGETGTGKELIARAIHERSPRRHRLLVKVSGAALAPSLITSELFGHEAGAFTGASKRRPGRFELAHQGTILLDEIDELPPESQVLLLRVLQERVIERVGGNDPLPVDVRVIAATHRDLSKLVQQGDFREDLYYRLNVFPIRVPPLRERREDLPALVDHFIAHFNRQMNKAVQQISDRTRHLLESYSWPGNVRELQNLVERAMIVATGDTLVIEPRWLESPVRAAGSAVPSSLAELERQSIVDALQQAGGRVYGPCGAAAILGIKPTTLYGKMRKHGIRRPQRVVGGP